MITLFDQLATQTWRERSRVARERLDLSASVEEVLVRSSESTVSSAQSHSQDISEFMAINSESITSSRSSIAGESQPLPVVVRPSIKLGRTTKVRLKAAPKVEVGERPIEAMCEQLSSMPVSEIADASSMSEEDLCGGVEETRTSAHLAAVKIAASSQVVAGNIQFGSGFFEIGQADVPVVHTSIAAEDVVLVMLTGDPGPVVVQYISIRAETGFTVHLSAPTNRSTPFNYVVLKERSA